MTRSSQNERGGHSCSNLTNQLLSSMERAVEWEPKELKVYPPIYRFGPAGRWLRERLQAGKVKNLSRSTGISKFITPGGPAHGDII